MPNKEFRVKPIKNRMANSVDPDEDEDALVFTSLSTLLNPCPAEPGYTLSLQIV